MTDPLSTISTRRTPQNQPAPGAPAPQVKNSAGGYVFTVDDETRLRRFLTLGTDGATYYVGANELTAANAAVVLHLAENDHALLRRVIREISLAGRAPKQNPTLFALAIACSIGTPLERTAALDMLPAIARTGTHLFQFAGYVQQFRGWGRGLRRAVAAWYTDKDPERLGYQVAKYRQRDGWTHRDLLRLAHPVPTDHPYTGRAGIGAGPREDGVAWRRELAQLTATFSWITHGWSQAIAPDLPKPIEGYLVANGPDANLATWLGAIRDYRLSWEMLPSKALNEPKVWEALLEAGIPQTALMRQLPRLTRLGVVGGGLAPGSHTSEVVDQLVDPVRLEKARVHPMNVLVALRTYASGRSARGDGTWSPVPAVVDALDAAFYQAFGNVVPSGKRTLQALDVSGSMGASISNMPLTCAEASAALSLITAATEERSQTVAFSTTARNANLHIGSAALVPLPISPRQRLDDVLRMTAGVTMGATDCALPILAAKAQRLEVDTFVVYTDSETWSGGVHPYQALREYRQTVGVDAKLVVVGMTATPFSIADPTDPGMLDVAGFDSSVPQLIGDFSRGL